MPRPHGRGTGAPPPPPPIAGGGGMGSGPAPQGFDGPRDHHINIVEMELDKEVGRGAYGVVFKGRCRGRDVAIKQIDVKGGTDSPEYEKQLKEFHVSLLCVIRC